MTKLQDSAATLITRVDQARTRLAGAVAAADLAGMAEALDELERVHALAREGGVAIPQVAGATGTNETPS